MNDNFYEYGENNETSEKMPQDENSVYRYQYTPYDQPGQGSGRGPQKQKNKFGVKLVKAACIGVVFGVVSGGCFVAVNHLVGGGNSKMTASNGVAAINVVQTSSTNVQTIEAQDVTDIVDAAMPAIVAVNTEVTQNVTDYFGRTYSQSGQGAGSGIILSQDNDQLYIITNNHVIEDSTSISVQFIDNTTAAAEVMGYDSNIDVAVIKVDMSALSQETKDAIAVAAIGDSDSLEAGNSAIAIGNALGYGQSVTTGVVSAANREIQFTDGAMEVIQTDAAINPGNSGGALLNGKGEVIGINTSKSVNEQVEGMGYAIPINKAVTIAKEIMEGMNNPSLATEAYMGISGGTINESTASQLNCPQGVYVSEITEGTAAANSDLQAGDIITAYNGEATTTMEELQTAIKATTVGDTVTLTVQRQVQAEQGRGYTFTEQTISLVMGSQSDKQEETASTQSYSSENGSSQNPFSAWGK